MLILKEGETELFRVTNGSAFRLPNGDFVSPAEAGWDNGIYRLVEEPAPPEIILTPEQRRHLLPELSRLQFRLLLRSIGITEQDVAALIANITDPEEQYLVDLHWREASVYKRTHPLIAVAANAMGLTDEQIDDAWESFNP